MNHLLTDSICKKIKALRKKYNYSQEEVAEVLNMSQNTYSEFESGKTKLDIERLSQIAALFKISVSELLPPPTGNITKP